jgi:hypothetical protein
MSIEYGKDVQNLLQATVATGYARMKLCNTPNENAIQTLINEINDAFKKAAHSSHKTGGSTVL